MIICLSGKSASGKDTVADVLVRNFRYVKVAFADGLRDLVCQTFDLPRELFIDRDKKEAKFLYPIRLDEEHISHILNHIENQWSIPVSEGSKNKMLLLVGNEMETPRKMLQFIGSELVRDCISEDFWINLVDKKIDNLADVVITDARLSNERDFARNKNALMCLINRPTLKNEDSHRAENDLGNESDYQIVMNNDDSLSRFQIEVGSFFNNYLSRGIK